MMTPLAIPLAALMIGASAPQPLDDAFEILDALDEQHMTVRFDERRLGDVLAELSGQLPVPIRADWESMVRMGVDDDEFVSFEVRDGRAATVLSALVVGLAMSSIDRSGTFTPDRS